MVKLGFHKYQDNQKTKSWIPTPHIIRPTNIQELKIVILSFKENHKNTKLIWIPRRKRRRLF